MPKTVFGNGSEVSPAWFNAQQNLLFDGLDLDGHQPLLTDSALSNTPGNIKADWSLFKNAFTVMAGAGLAVNVIGGIFTNSFSIPITVASGGISVPASTTSFIWISDAGVITIGASLPAIVFPIASVVTSPSAVTLITDLRPRFVFGPQTRSIAVFGGRSNVDVVYSSNVSVDGVINCRNFTLNAGVTLTVATGFLKIVASGTVTINGTINVTAPIGGGAALTGGMSAPSLFPADSGKGFGGGAGHNNPGGKSYPFEASQFGSGGASGLVSAINTAAAFGYVNFTSSRGGNGGGSVVVESAGIISVAGSINCNGENGVVGAIGALSSALILVTGGGGGSGGSIALRSLSQTIVTAAGSLSVRGGNGADGRTSNTSYLSVGGGGGGGGRVFLASPSTNITGATILLTAGNAGLNEGSFSSGIVNGSPGGGFGGTGGGSVGGAGGIGSIGQLTLQSFITV